MSDAATRLRDERVVLTLDRIASALEAIQYALEADRRTEATEPDSRR